MTTIRWAMVLAVLSLLLICTGVTYAFVSTARHQDNACGRASNGRVVPQPDPCARTEADGRIVLWLLAPGLAGLLGACALGFAGSLRRSGEEPTGVGRPSPADTGLIRR